jgi:hypothetical protein
MAASNPWIPTLQGIPAELRNIIFEYLLIGTLPYKRSNLLWYRRSDGVLRSFVVGNSADIHSNILSTCTQFYGEGREMLYRNTISIDVWILDDWRFQIACMGSTPVDAAHSRTHSRFSLDELFNRRYTQTRKLQINFAFIHERNEQHSSIQGGNLNIFNTEMGEARWHALVVFRISQKLHEQIGLRDCHVTVNVCTYRPFTPVPNHLAQQYNLVWGEWILGSLTELTVRKARVTSMSPRYANAISAAMVRTIPPRLNVFDRIKRLPAALVQEADNVDVRVSTNLGARYPWGLLGPWSKLLWSAVKLDIHGFHQSKLDLYQNPDVVNTSGQHGRYCWCDVCLPYRLTGA